jgi:hypothetical protein
VNQQHASWWETRWLAALLILISALPLLWPDIPPFVDLPGHMASYKAELDYARSPSLQHFYTFRWSLIGNLGVNLLVLPLGRLIGLEPAVKLILLCVPPLTVAGFLWVAREVHGRIPPTALFALPLAYNFPLNFGFVNFCLSMALMFPALALWLRLGRVEQARLRALLFVPLSCLVWLAHVYGWAMLCVTAFSAEWIRAQDRGLKPVRAGSAAALHCLPLGIAVLPLLIWRSGDVGGATESWFSVIPKLNYLITPLRDRWAWLDLPSVLLLFGLLVLAWRSPRLAFSRSLGAAVIVLGIAYLLLPQRIFGSAYADMRLYPFTLALAVLAVRPQPGASEAFRRTLAMIGLAFFLFRIGVNTASFRLYDQSYDRELAALNHVPMGARLVSFVGTPCRGDWTMHRLDHLPALALVRREAFSNDQWSVPGAQMLQTRYAAAEPFARDPSQIVRLRDCPINRWRRLDESLRLFPRGAFDYLWLINPPAYDPRLTASLQPVWRGGASILFRIPHPERTR